MATGRRHDEPGRRGRRQPRFASRVALLYNTDMSNRQTTVSPRARRSYRGADVPIRVIRQFARRVAERFQPEKIILFGSHAYGEPHADSDVDILVIMPARNELDQAVRISLTIDPPFPLDIDVRTPKTMKWRLEQGDSFLREVIERGKVLYEKVDRGVGDESRRRLRRRPRTGQGKEASA